MKKILKTVAALTALVLLISACGIPASAESADEIVNVVLVAGESFSGTYFPLLDLIVSLNFTTKSMKVINFYYETQIFAVAKNGKTVSIPMAMLPNCENEEVAKAFETTFGVPIDRYLIYVYEYGSFQPVIGVLDRLFQIPITLEVPQELLGTEQYTTINGSMRMIAEANNREYTPIDEAGTYELDAVGYLGFNTAIPGRVFESSDRFTRVVEDYKYLETKQEADIYALREVIGRLNPDTVAVLLQMLVGGQMTNITQEDIALWSVSGVNLDADDPYMNAPGVQNAAMVTADTSSLPINAFQNKMLTYDNEALKRRIHAFLYGE